MKPLNIGITCFPTFGGSGMVATEIGLGMAERGHRVHFIARELPVRLQDRADNVLFHNVVESDSAVLKQSSAYPIALASRMIEVATAEKLDILHVHYAVPHATAAWMAKEVLGDRAPHVVTTLHGTDITLVGIEPNHLPITRFSVLKSDAVTTPSAFLRRATHQNLSIPDDTRIDVIPNFVDTQRYAPVERTGRTRLKRFIPDLRDDEIVLFHVSNFRPVKRVLDVIGIFAAVNARAPSRLVMIGDGPDRVTSENRLHALRLTDRVVFPGNARDFAGALAEADVFLLPSETEGFGLAALEAMACGIPVVASDVGGLPEVVRPGIDGWLVPVGDVQGMAAKVLSLVENRAVWAKFSGAARQRVVQDFQRAPAVDRYEALYRRVLA